MIEYTLDVVCIVKYVKYFKVAPIILKLYIYYIISYIPHICIYLYTEKRERKKNFCTRTKCINVFVFCGILLQYQLPFCPECYHISDFFSFLGFKKRFFMTCLFSTKNFFFLITRVFITVIKVFFFNIQVYLRFIIEICFYT